MRQLLLGMGKQIDAQAIKLYASGRALGQQVRSEGAHLGIAGVVLPVLDPQHGVVGDAGFAGHAGQFAHAPPQFDPDSFKDVVLHAPSLGTHALKVKAAVPCYTQHMPSDGRQHDEMNAKQIEDMAAEALADNVARLLDANGKMTQPRLAKKAGLDQKTIWRIVKKSNSTTLATISAVAAAFELQAWQLLVPGLQPNNPPVYAMNKTERELYERIKDSAKRLAEVADDH